MRQQAAQALLAGYVGRLVAWGQRFRPLTAQDAEELVVDTVHKFLDKCPDDWDWPEAWVITTFRHAACSLARRRRREAALFMPLEADARSPDPAPAPIDHLAADPAGHAPLQRLLDREQWALAREMLQYAIGRSAQRAAVVRLHMEGRSHEEIAQALGKSPGSVRDLFYRVKKLAIQLYEDTEQ